MIIRSVPLTFSPLAVFASQPDYYSRDTRWRIKGYSTASDRYTLTGPSKIAVNIDNAGYAYTSSSAISLSLSQSATWDTTSGTNYTVAANRAGKDFYVYACKPVSGTMPNILVSANSTYPYGYTASTSRKIAGFHCMAGNVGTISGHTLTGFVTGDIVPQSVWDLKWRPSCDSPEGMVYDPGTNIWVDIYLASLVGGTGDPYAVSSRKVASVNGGTIYDTDTWFNFVQRGINTGKRLPYYHEFMSLATGSNEQTSIQGAADPVTTGWHLDSAGRAMVSNIGVVDACGAMVQLGALEPTYARLNSSNPTAVTGTASSTESGKLIDASKSFDTTYIGGVVLNTTTSTWAVIIGQDSSTKLSLSANIISSGNSYAIYRLSHAAMNQPASNNTTGSRGLMYFYGSTSMAVSYLGGSWANGSECGSRYISLLYTHSNVSASTGGRYVCSHISN